jgi:predicted esterase
MRRAMPMGNCLETRSEGDALEKGPVLWYRSHSPQLRIRKTTIYQRKDLDVEQRVTIPMACFFDVQIPDAPPARWGHPLLIALHGYGGTKESMLSLAHRICGDRCAIASLQGTHQHTQRRRASRTVRIAFGWGTMHNSAENQALHHEFIRRVIREISRRHRIDRGKIFLLGFSQSVGLNYRFAFTYPNTIRGVVGVCGGIPGDWEESPKYRRSRTDILHISGTKDPFYPLERVRTFKAALERRAASVEHQFVPTRHVFPRRAIPAIRRWLLSRI